MDLGHLASDHHFVGLMTMTTMMTMMMGLVFLWYYSRRSSKKGGMSPPQPPPPPEPASCWPIIGHLHHLLFQSGKVSTFRTLGAMADKLGPVFVIRLGMFPTLVVSDREAVKECFTTNDRIFASRPPSALGKIIGYDYALFALAPYGPLWREVRKISVLQLLSPLRLRQSTHVHVSEVEAGLKDLFLHCVDGGDNNYNNDNNDNNYNKEQQQPPPREVVMSDWFDHMSFNIVMRMISGKRYFNNLVHGGGQERSAILTIKELSSASGAFVASDAIPFLECLDLKGHLSSMKNLAGKLDSLVGSWVEEHVGRVIDSAGPDFIDVMLSNLKEHDSIFGYSSNTIIKATIVTMIVGGSETTSATSTWVLSALLNHKHVMKQAQEELDSKVGRERWVEPSDIPNLVYLKAIVKETLRLYPTVPLLLPHEAMEDCTVGGYHITKGTRLLVNAWKLHRDPTIWSNPDQFQPERFLTSHADVDVYGQHFEFIPFGSGRRSCPGNIVALQIIHLAIARLLQGFDMTTPSDSPVDMSEGISLGMPKATPLEVVLTPRLNMQLY